MSNFIPTVTQDEELTMDFPQVPEVPAAAARAPRPLNPANPWWKHAKFPKSKSVQVQAHTRRDGSRVVRHIRHVKTNKVSKVSKSTKPKHNFDGIPPETVKLIKSMMIQDNLNLVRGNK